jgi:hypothetical protein
MSAAAHILHELEAIGAIIVPTGDCLLLRAGPKSVPASIIRRVREAKPELLALLRQEDAATVGISRLVRHTDGEPSLEQPCAARRGRVEERERVLLHFCAECGAWGAFGYGVNLRCGRLGRWYCAAHRPLG